MTKIKLGQLDHMHLVVPNRDEAAKWFEETLGFERVKEYKFWETVQGGPLHMSADDGASGIALFEASEYHINSGIGMGVAFKLPAESFITFAKALDVSMELKKANGEALTAESIVDLDLCYSFGFVDPWGHTLELNCYDYERVKLELIERENITPTRFW